MKQTLDIVNLPKLCWTEPEALLAISRSDSCETTKQENKDLATLENVCFLESRFVTNWKIVSGPQHHWFLLYLKASLDIALHQHKQKPDLWPECLNTHIQP